VTVRVNADLKSVTYVVRALYNQGLFQLRDDDISYNKQCAGYPLKENPNLWIDNEKTSREVINVGSCRKSQFTQCKYFNCFFMNGISNRHVKVTLLKITILRIKCREGKYP
jgi:hypothetical protein